jgi:hypothetical protein
MTASSSATGLNATSAVLSVIAFVFFLIGVIGYSNDNDTVKNVNWFNLKDSGSENGNADFYLGLSRVAVEIPGGGSQAFVFADCDGSTCDDCEREGKNAFGLLIISTIMAFVTAALTMGASAAPSSALSGASVATSFVAFVFGIIGWSLFVKECYYDNIKDSFSQKFDYGAGSVLPLIAFLLSFLIFILQIAAAATSGAAGASNHHAPAKAEAVATNEL